MLDQPEEEGQVPGIDPLLVERKDVGAALGQQQVVGVLDPLGDALAGDGRADIVLRDERGKLVVGDFGVDGHRVPARREEESGRILAKERRRGEPLRRLAHPIGHHLDLGEAGRERGGAGGRGDRERGGERVGRGGAGRDHRDLPRCLRGPAGRGVEQVVVAPARIEGARDAGRGGDGAVGQRDGERDRLWLCRAAKADVPRAAIGMTAECPDFADVEENVAHAGILQQGPRRDR